MIHFIFQLVQILRVVYRNARQKPFVVGFLILTSLNFVPAEAASYNVNVTRIGQDFYSIDGNTTILHTAFCYEYAYSEGATLSMSGFSGAYDGAIRFSNNQTCDVAGAYVPVNVAAGTYNANLTIDSGGMGFYLDAVQRLVVRASPTCFQYHYYDSSTLILNYGGGVAYSSGMKIGTILFSDRSTCDMTGIYVLADLTGVVTTRGNQSISFATVPAFVVGGKNQLSATASSGLAVTFVSASPSICTVSGSQVTGVAVGTCTVTANQAGNASYYAAPRVTQNIAVTASTQSASAPGAYDGIYQWDAGYYLSMHQIGGGTLIGTIYWVYTANPLQVGRRTISEADTFDLFHGQIIGSSAAMTGTRFYRGCSANYDFTFNSDSSLTVRLNSISNSPGVSTADVDCAARYNPVGSIWTIPRLY